MCFEKKWNISCFSQKIVSVIFFVNFFLLLQLWLVGRFLSSIICGLIKYENNHKILFIIYNSSWLFLFIFFFFYILYLFMALYNFLPLVALSNIYLLFPHPFTKAGQVTAYPCPFCLWFVLWVSISPSLLSCVQELSVISFWSECHFYFYR